MRVRREHGPAPSSRPRLAPHLGQRSATSSAPTGASSTPSAHAHAAQPGQLGGLGLGRRAPLGPQHARRRRASSTARWRTCCRSASWSCSGRATRRRPPASTPAWRAPSRRRWLQELGIPCVHIDPFLNHTASWIGGTWLAPRPTTSVALAHAIAWVWVTEGLYDEEYVAERTTGFEAWRDYLLGADDGVPKTPEWQEAETGVPGARGPRPGARLGRQEDVPRGRRPRQHLRRRLSLGHGHRVGALHGLPDGDAWARQARASTWATCSAARRSTPRSTSPATARAASPATSRAR